MNSLPSRATSAPSIAIFRQCLKTFPFHDSYPDLVIWLVHCCRHCGPSYTFCYSGHAKNLDDADPHGSCYCVAVIMLSCPRTWTDHDIEHIRDSLVLSKNAGMYCLCFQINWWWWWWWWCQIISLTTVWTFWIVDVFEDLEPHQLLLPTNNNTIHQYSNHMASINIKW